MKKALVGVMIILLALPVLACAMGPIVVKHTAIWDANTEADLAGYYLYWKYPTGQYQDSSRVQVPKAASPTYDLLTLQLPSGQYSLVVTAYDNEGNESGPSNEVLWDASYPGEPKNTKVQ